MIVTTRTVEVIGPSTKLRAIAIAPKNEERYPGLLVYSDIFQNTNAHLRVCTRLASYGFNVVTPEIWNRLEPAGSAIAFDDPGRTRGLDNATKTAVADLDADCRATLDWLKSDARTAAQSGLAVMGFCIGGHLAFRAALQPDVRASVCFYPTGVHNGKLGRDADAGTLQRVSEIKGELLLVYGTKDPHVPEDARAKIAAALKAAGTRFETALYDAEHAFMRDEGPRWNPEATDRAFERAVAFVQSSFGAGVRR